MPTDHSVLGSRTSAGFLVALVLSLTFVAYSGVIRYEFVLDDTALIVENPAVHSWQFLPRYFTRSLWGFENPNLPGNYYRPVFYFWLRLNHMLFGLNPAGWHLTTLGMHLVVTLLVYLLAARVLRERLAAIFAAAIFGLHPIHIEAVAWVCGVTDPLEAALFLGSLLCFLKSRDRELRSRAWMAASLVLYGFAILAKESAAVLPLIIVAYKWLYGCPGEGDPGARPHGGRIVRAFRTAVPYLGLTAIYVLMRVRVVKGLTHTMTEMPLTTVFFTAPSVLWFYVKHMVWPFGLSAFYDPPYVIRIDVSNFAVPATALAILVGGLGWWARRNREAAFAALLLAAPVLPLLNFRVFLEGEIAHDRYMYLPSVGFAILCALGWRRLKFGSLRIFGQPGIQVLLTVMIGGVLGVATAYQSVYWADNLVLYSHGLKVAPNNALAKINLANLAVKRGYYAAAAKLYQQVLERRPNLWLANYNLGYAYYRQGKLEEAERSIIQATEANPLNAQEFLALGIIRAERGRPDQGERDIRRAIELAPDGANNHYALGLVLKARGDLAGALSEFKAELANNPEQSAAREQVAEIEARIHSTEPQNPRDHQVPLDKFSPGQH